MTARRETVLVTNGEAKSALTVVRALARRGLAVQVGAESRLAVAGWSRFARRLHVLPSSKEQPREFVRELRRLQERWQFDAVIPVADTDIAALLAAEPDARAGLSLALPPAGAFGRALDKSLMMKCAAAAGVPCPETYYPEDEPIASIRDRARYPVLVKPNISAGARGITLVSAPDQLEATLQAVVERWGPAHVQELIPEGGGQYKSDIVVGPNGETLALFTCRKIRYFPVEGGSSTLIVSEHHPQIDRDVPRLTRALGWYGFADFDFIVDPRDGIAKLMECNPRFPESLAVNVFAGMDFPWLVYQLARTGTAAPVADFVERRYARFLVGDLMWFRHSRQRWRAQPSFFRFLSRDLKYYVEQWDDPGPTLCYLCDSILTLFSSRLKAYRFDRGFRRSPVR